MSPSRLRSRALRAALAAALVEIVGAQTIGVAHAGALGEPPKALSFRLDDPSASSLPWLVGFQGSEGERPGVASRYLVGPWSRWRARPWRSLPWLAAPDDAAAPQTDTLAPDLPWTRTDELALRAPAAPGLAAGFDWLRRSEGSTPAFAWTGPSLASNGFDSLWSPPAPPVPRWKCRRRPVTFVRLGAERDSFPLVLCDGTVAPEALDRLSIVARETGAPHPGGLLPDEPDPTLAEQGEWTRGVRIIHPRLLWAMQRLADAFPWRTIYVYSGYRPTFDAKPGSHASRHGSGRALDVGVLGVANEQLFEACRKLHDVGCGFYPNSKFIHVDVRGPATGHPFWIDISRPGEPSQYVDSWPGVIDAGGLVWDARATTPTRDPPSE
jgi:hypothetical protein